jgi:phospholipid-translocating ATPase
VVGQGKVCPVAAKVEAIVDFPSPTGKKAIQRFLGMAGYYRKYCKNFSNVVSPLTDLLKKDVKFVWSDKCEQAFCSIKKMLASSPVLVMPRFDAQFILMTDASEVGAGAVLLQKQESGVEHPIAYYSKKFNKHEKNYSTIEKEGLALILALQHFEVYLNPTVEPVLVYTDHNPLVFVNRMKYQNRRILRWSLILQEFNLDIRHVAGKDNVISDCLSRGG